MSLNTRKYFTPFLLRLLTIFTIILLALPGFSQQSSNYDEAIALADKLFKQENYLNAKAYYQMALKYKLDDQYAKDKITDIVGKMKARMAQEDEYYDLIDLADIFYEEGAYDKAIMQYGKALEIIPGDEYASGKIREINKIKSDEKDRITAFVNAMDEGNELLAANKYQEAIAMFQEAQLLYPDRTAPAGKIDLTRQMMADNATKMEIFNKEVEEAGRYLLIKNYVVALEHYEIALALFPSNKEILAKVDEIMPQAENQRKYNEQLEMADNLYISKDYMGARKQYETAGMLWPENSYPRDMISRIDDLIAEQRKNLEQNYQSSIKRGDSLFTLNEFDQAKADYNLALTLKPNESYPKSKLREIDAYYAEQLKAFEANYSDMVYKADSLFQAKQFNLARDQYNFALTVKPDDEYPKTKLLEIEQQLVLLAQKEKLNASYQELIAEADNLYQNGHYDLAVKKYTEAQAVKSTEGYPEQRIGEIRQLLMDAEKQREIEEKYSTQIILAARLFKDNNLDESKKAYENALELKPYEELPKQQIFKIDSTVNAKIRAAEVQKIYLAHISRGDSLMELLEYDGAIKEYEAALLAKPGGQEADQRLLTARTTKRNYERAQERQANYDKAIRDGDQLFEQKSYELAKIEFQKASEIKIDEPYPKQQLNEISIILKRLEAEKEQRYKDAIVKADNFYEQSNYQEAVIQYKTAKSIKPAEQYPQSRIEECNTRLAEQLRKVKNQYDLAISDADKLYASKIYDKAIRAYQKAEKIKPDESYPREMITKITKYIEENAIFDVVKKVVTINAGVTERFSFEPIRINVRKSNYVLVKAKNLGEGEFKIIFTYGSDKGKNGGFVVQVPAGQEYNDFIIRVGNQYKWFSEDNDWLSIYPENGDIEIKLVRISTSN